MRNADEGQSGDDSASELADEILKAGAEVGVLESWVEQQLDGSANLAIVQAAYRELTRRLICATAPDVAVWEHVIVTTAISAERSNLIQSTEACRAALAELQAILADGLTEGFPPDQIVTLASALTLVLAAQREVRQDIETSVELLRQRFPDKLQEMAERCQDIWKRHGQMSGVDGLYVWDRRKQEWRLTQDFKPYRPASE